MTFSRRSFINATSAFSLGMLGLQTLSLNGRQASRHLGYGKLIKDVAGILDLPADFNYKIIGRRGDKMSDGFFLPDKPDGMATFHGSCKEEVILVRNHEINPRVSGVSGPFGKNNQLAKNLSAKYPFKVKYAKVSSTKIISRTDFFS